MAIAKVDTPLVAVRAEPLLGVGAAVLIEAKAVVERQSRRDLKLVLEEERVVLENVLAPDGSVIGPERGRQTVRRGDVEVTDGAGGSRSAICGESRRVVLIHVADLDVVASGVESEVRV